MVLAEHQVKAVGSLSQHLGAPGSHNPTLVWARGALPVQCHPVSQCCSSPLDWENWAAVVALLLSHSHCLSPQWLTVSPEQQELLVGDSCGLPGVVLKAAPKGGQSGEP